MNTNKIIKNITSRPTTKMLTKEPNCILIHYGIIQNPSGHKSNERCEMVTRVGMEIAMTNQNKETETFEPMYMK